MNMLAADIYSRVMSALTFLSQGRTLTSACAEAGLSAVTLQKYVNSTPELRDAFIEAEQSGYDTLADILLNIFEDSTYGHTETKKAKIISDNIKWYLARKRPSQYGDRTIVETHITADKAIVEALSRGRERAEKAVLEDVAYKVLDTAVGQIAMDAIAEELREFI